MRIDREKDQGGFDVAQTRVSFCLDHMEDASEFKNGLHWDTEVTHHLTIDELIMALVSAEQELKGMAISND